MKIRFLLVLPAILLLLSGCRPQEQGKVLKLAHGLDPSHPVHSAMVFMADRCKEISKGELSIDIYPSGQLGSEQQCVELLQIGSLAITKVSKPPQLIFNAISEARPEGVSILKYKIDLDTGYIDVIGISSTRQALIDFKQALEEFEDFSLVQIPITNLEKEADLEYSLRFRYLPVITKGASKK